MSAPVIGGTLHAIRSELISAGSALHMPPEPITNPEKDAIFLDELDHNAKHVREHLNGVHRCLDKFHDEWRERLREELKHYGIEKTLTPEQYNFLFRAVFSALNYETEEE